MDLFTIDYLLAVIKNNIGILFFILALLLLYNHYSATHGHFREMGIPFKKPVIILGNIGERVFLRTSFHEFNIKIYNYFDGLPYGGYFEGRRPLLLIRDPDLIKNIMIKDFDHFTDRNSLTAKEPLFIKKMLLNLKGKEWKKIRGSLTPAFSSGKLRAMENLLEQCGDQMCTFLKNREEGNTDVDMKEFIGRYTLEVIGTCAFGVECSSLKDPNAEFVKMAARFGDIPLARRMFFFFMLLFCPGAIKYVQLSFFNEQAIHALSEVVAKSKHEREKNPENRRNDFLQLMLDTTQKEMKEEEIIMTEDVVKGQAILFLIAGFETTSTLLSFCCSILSENIELQDQLRKQIQLASMQTDKENIYDKINDIPLLEKVLLETLRMYPPVSRVDRVCTKPITLEGTNVNINVGDIVVIPIAGIMHDPQHYPNPDKFDPERFSPEEKAKRPAHLFLPFGAGPRNCIGLRFAMMSAKFGLYYLLKDFALKPCSKSESPISFDRRSFLLKAAKGNWVKVESL